MTAFTQPPLSLRARLLPPLVRLMIGRIFQRPRPVAARRAALARVAAINHLPAPRGSRWIAGQLGGRRSVQVDNPRRGARGTLLYFHGGGYLVGSPESHRPVLLALANRGALTVHAPDYRLAPEHPFPAAVEDALAAYRELLERGLQPGEIVIGGDSAGGGLTLACCLAARAAGLPLPAGLLLFSPWVDLTASGASMVSQASRDPVLSPSAIDDFVGPLMGGADRAQPLASPLFADLAGLPPVFIQATDREILADDARRLHRALAAAGVTSTLQEWQGLWHVWQIFAGLLPEADQALADGAGFLRQCLDGGSPR
ncbi:MAG TPA: alpha/beta hydrolase [Nevskiaceae bacterium]|nr:alpha/beta hydrolase [Nevskiaceae bacterium]